MTRNHMMMFVSYRVPQKKVGLVENRLWQILMLIVRNPGAILDKSISVFIICLGYVQSVSSSLAKHGGALFSAVSWSIKDPIGAPGPYEPQEC